MHGLFHDLRFALRSIGRSPAFAVVTIVTLGLGIGANTAIFSVIHAVLLRPLPYHEPDRIVAVWKASPNSSRDANAPGDYLDIRNQARTIGPIATHRQDSFDLIAEGADPERLDGAHVTAGFFDVFGVRPAAGRLISEAIDKPEGERLVVISYAFWKRRFAGEQGVIGKRLRLSGTTGTVVGVAPAGFVYPQQEDVWVLSPLIIPPSPITLPGDLLASRDLHYLPTVARLRPDVSLQQAQSELTAIGQRLQQQYPATNTNRTFRVIELREDLVGDSRLALVILFGAVALVLLIACANVASVSYARGAARHQELAVRAAMGASRRRIARQLITESLVLALMGGLAGVIVARISVRLLVSIAPHTLPRKSEIALDPSVLLFTLVVSLVTGLMFGIAPSIQVSRPDLMHRLRVRSGTARGSISRRVLVVAEVAMALVLLVSAGLLMNSFLRLQSVDPGFRTRDIIAVKITLPQTRYETPEAQTEFYRQLVERVGVMPGVQMAAAAHPRPRVGAERTPSAPFSIDGQPRVPRGDRPIATLCSVTPAYFRLLDIPTIEGRGFTEDDKADGQPVIVINQSFARRFWPATSAVGQKLDFGGDGYPEWFTIVGVVGDVHVWGLDEPPPPTVYFPYKQFMLPGANVVVRSSMDEPAVTALVRAAVRELDGELPLGEVRTLESVVAESTGLPRFRLLLLLVFAALALLLAVVGVYGVVSQSITDRLREIGIRIAIGASPREVLHMVLREGFAMGLIGVFVGALGSLALTRLIRAFLFGVPATDPITYLSVAFLLLGMIALATWVPARRAARVDPIIVLNSE